MKTVVALAIVAGLAVGEAAAASSKYAAIVIDANTGKTLYSANADAPRYPASLTKMMTLYLVFEALAAGKVSRTTQIPVSQNAANEAPSKLGLKAGQTVSVETAIYALVTKSANDAAMAVGEYLGGSQAGFAAKMTAKARRLGMTGSVFYNPNGLPDPRQRTTARDMAILGLALRAHFPKYYAYFATKSFTYGKRRMANHNKLLGRVEGVDGIKTGYTRASGFNLVSSVTRGNRRLVAVVMGGESGRSRDRHMADLIETYLPKAAQRGSGGALVASRTIEPSETMATADAATARPTRKAPRPAETEQVAQATPQAVAKPQEVAKQVEKTVETALAENIEAPAAVPAKPVEAKTAEAKSRANVDPIETASTAPSGWVIQVASTPTESDARDSLSKATQLAGSVLREASPFTQSFDKSGTTYYRARFGGFSSKTAAWNACSALKRKKIDCYAVLQ